jgi:hypothetical protein
MQSFVPLYLGFESITREQIIKDHTRPLAKTLLGGDDDGLILVLDGTCIYIFKKATISLFKEDRTVFFSPFFIKDGIAALITRSSSKVRESRNPLSTTNMSLSLTKPLMSFMLHFNMWFNIEASLFLAMYGPRIATKWPVVVTTTIGLTSGLDL